MFFSSSLTIGKAELLKNDIPLHQISENCKVESHILSNVSWKLLRWIKQFLRVLNKNFSCSFTISSMPCCSLTFARNFNWTPICGKVRFRAFQFVIILWIDFPWIFLPFFDFAKCNFVLCVSYLWLLKNCILWDHTLKEHNDQCDQIGRNFATLAKKMKVLGKCLNFYFLFSKCWAYFGKFVTLLG